MGFLKGTLNVISNVATLGGASRLENAKAEYQQSYAEHERLCIKTKALKEQIEQHIAAIGACLTATKPVLARSEKILKKSVSGKKQVNFQLTVSTLNHVQRFNSDYNSAIGIGTGTVAGSSLAVGSWALVGALGSASTGAAISGLSGVAASNATLAWFGGGALAAGGAGISGGMAMLGGIVAVPLIGIASYGTHKKANEFQEEKAKLDRTIDKQKQHLATLPEVLNSVERKRGELLGVCEDFKSVSKNLIKIIRPFGVFSAFKQRLFIILGLKPFKEPQLQALNQLNEKVIAFLAVFQENRGRRQA